MTTTSSSPWQKTPASEVCSSERSVQVNKGAASVTGRTTVAAVIGDPVTHSRSPAIHNAAFAAAGLDWVFVALTTAEGHVGHALGAMEHLGLGGLSVTMPHKQAVASALDHLDPLARRLDAVNCVVRGEDGLVGYNTDASGFVASVGHAGHDLAGRSMVVLGAGGAARAVIAGALGAGVRNVVVINRNQERAAVAAALDPVRCVVGDVSDVAGADVVVNASPVGMSASPGLPLGAEQIHAGQVVVDLVYDPVDTALLATARDRGAATVDGLGMLVHQAADAFRLWTGVEPPLEAMANAAVSATT